MWYFMKSPTPHRRGGFPLRRACSRPCPFSLCRPRPAFCGRSACRARPPPAGRRPSRRPPRYRFGVVPRAPHGLHHLPLEPPAGLLPQFQLARELGGGEPLFVGRQEVYDPKCLERVELQLVEESARRGRLHIAAPSALPGVRRRPLAATAVAAFGTVV